MSYADFLARKRADRWEHGVAIEVPDDMLTRPDLHDCWSTSTQIQRRFAVKVCQHCPVRAECADHAVRTRETDGVWGGLIPEQLRALQRRQVPA